MATEVITNRAVTNVTSGGSTAPAGGTVETWTVVSSSGFPAVATGVTQFHIADVAQPTELIAVTNVSGTTWTVTRGDEGTTPVAHAASGFTVYLTVTAGFLNGLATSSGTLQLTGGSMAGPLATQTPNVVFDGDSLTQGTGALPFNNFPNGNDYPSQVAATLDPKGAYYMVGVGGELVAAMIVNAPAVVDTKLAAGANNIVVMAGGTNDLQSTDNATTTYNRIVTYCQARQAAGWKVVVSTLTPRSDAGTPADFDTVRLTVNALIRANWATFANALADIGADPNMGTAGQETNTQYYNGDLVHHNPVGYGVRASYVLAALSRLGVTGHKQSDRSGLVSDLWIPATALFAVSGSPVLAQITAASYPAWSLHHGTVDIVAGTVILPREWMSFTVDAVWTNTATATGNAILALRYAAFTISNWATPSNLATTTTAGGNQTVTSPVSYRPVNTPLGTLNANNGAAPRVAWNIGVQRNGTSGSDTLTTDVVGLLGIYLYRVT